jgi:hypothetical protein
MDQGEGSLHGCQKVEDRSKTAGPIGSIVYLLKERLCLWVQ